MMIGQVVPALVVIDRVDFRSIGRENHRRASTALGSVDLPDLVVLKLAREGLKVA